MKRSVKKMKKKKVSGSDSEYHVLSRSLRERKTKKVMPKHLAEEIDAEAKSHGAVSLRMTNQDVSKSSWTVSDIGELDFERALYRWYERYQHERKEATRSEVEIILTTEELVKKGKNLVRVLGGSASLSGIVTKAWIHRWQDRYGVPKASEKISNDVVTASDSCEQEIRQKEAEEKLICMEPIKQRLKKKGLESIEKSEEESNVKLEEKQLLSPDDDNLKRILTIDTGQEPEVRLQGTEELILKMHTYDGQQEYRNDQIYIAFCFELNWTSLPDQTLDDKSDDSVWLLMAANLSGRHRTRILVTGRQWRPQCLKHVNMLSQPVVYAGGGKGMLTPDLFSWWFHKEFVPAAESLNSESVLIAENKWLSSKLDKCVESRSVRFVPVPEAEVADWDLIYSEFKTRYATFLLKSVANSCEAASISSVAGYLKEFTLKDAFPFFHKSWLNIRSESFQRLSDLTLVAGGKKEALENFRTVDSNSSGLESSLINLTKGENAKIKDNFESINLTLKADEEKKEQKETGKLVLTRKANVSSSHVQEDRILLLELQWLAHDVGLEVTDETLSSWVLNQNPEHKDIIKVEEIESSVFGETDSLPTASEAIEYLNKALLWMETQPIDSNLLMTIRDVIDKAKQASKMGLAPPHPGAALPFFCHNGDHLTQPPPAHMGIPPYQLDAKGAGAMGEYWRGLGLGGLSIRPSASGPPGSPVPPHPAISPQDWKRLGPLLAASGLSRTPMYPFSAGSTYPYPMLSPEMSQVPASWHTPGMYPISAGAGFRSPYPTSLPISSTTLPSDFYRFSPTSLLPGHPGLSPHGHHSLSSHPAIVTPGPKQELGHHTQSDHNHRSSSLDHKNSSSSHHGRQDSKTQDSGSQNDKKKPHIKKPLNAFMLYMKEMRAKVVAECTLKESAAINQILGRRWHALGREEQAKYYELARRERQLHMQLYPDWSSRANSSRGKKRKRKQEANDGGNNMKKCRARYGLDQQSQWCKPCRRKKKCIRYLESGEERDGNQSEDNLGSCGSVGEARTPPDDDDGAESLPHSLSSPGGLSGLSSLTSPSMILPSPSTSLASPSVSLASPCMSLQSPLTPPTFDMKPIMPIALPPLNRNPVGTNPHDVNNPLSVNQLTGKCIKSEPKEQSRPISVT